MDETCRQADQELADRGGRVQLAHQPLQRGEILVAEGRSQLARGVGVGPDVLEDVTRRAAEFATARDAETIGTPDILFAVFDVYDKLFDRALYLRGTSREELVERLTSASAGARR